MHIICHWLTLSIFSCCMVATNAAFSIEQKAEQHHWNLIDLYPTAKDWERSQADLRSSLSELEQCRGKLGDSAKTLHGCLQLLFNRYRTLGRLQTYASLAEDQDRRNEVNGARNRAIELLSSELQQASSFYEPELLKVGTETLQKYLKQASDLAPYRVYLEKIIRRSAHTLDQQGEQLLAATTTLQRGPYNSYTVLIDADLPWQTITLSTGQTVRLDQTAYTQHRGSGNRADRKKVFDTFFASLNSYQRTFGSLLNTQMNGDVFAARSRHYDSSLAAAIDGPNIPEAVYRQLIESVNTNLATLHRYFRLRTRMLGVEQLHYYDMYPPLVKLDKSFSITEGKRLTQQSTQLLGPVYQQGLQEGFNNRWMDVFPSQGKAAGAYVNGAAYDVHPYVLMNYNNNYDSLSTLAHEWGHAIHSWLSNNHQPYATADYPTFLAEIASTFNEELLLQTMLKEAGNDQEKLFYLGQALENFRSTFFRQVMFAEFELALHEAVEQGTPLTGTRISAMYLELLKRYHGHKEGVVSIDPAYASEWAYVPHFYYNFYVYQYATSIAASTLLADQVLNQQDGALERYLDLLKAGGSKNAYELLKAAGVDMATPAPYEAAVARMNGIMDEIERLLDKEQ